MYTVRPSSTTYDRSEIVVFGRRSLCCKVQKYKAPAPRRAASTPTTPLQEIIEWRESVAEGRGSETRGWQCLFFPPAPKSRLSSKIIRRGLIMIININNNNNNNRPNNAND